MLRNKIQSKISLVALLLAMGCVPAFAQTTLSGNSNDPISVVKYSQDTPVTNQIILNECNGENVLMNGTMHFEYFFLTDADSDFVIYHVSSTSNLKGIGQTTGAKYVAHDSTNTLDRTRELASNQLMTLKSRLVAQGPTPDMLLRQIMRVVVDRKGNIKTDVVKQSVTCR